MPTLNLPGTWVNDVNTPLSAADLNMYRDAAVMLDGLTFRKMPMTCSSAAQTHGDAADWHSKGDFRHSWWGGLFRTGMTTLTIEGVNDYRFDFYLNGVFNSFQAATPGGFTKNITLSGYTDGDVVLLEIRTNGNPNPATGTTGYTPLYRVDDVYMSPISVTSAWGGVPTFAGTYSATLLNQLSDACQYIWDRVTVVPILPILGGTMVSASHRQETIRLLDGSIGRYASNEVFRVVGTLNCRTHAEHYEIDVNGVTVVTSSTYSEGQDVAISHPITLSHTLGTRVPVRIRAVIEDNTYAAFPGVFSSYTLIALRSEADSSGYSTQTPPTAFTAEESISAATLNSRLNSLATMLSTAKTRLDNRPEVWNRARLMRRVYSHDDTQVARNRKLYTADFIRQGDRLVVRGKGVKIAYGAVSYKAPEKENDPINYLDPSWATEQSVGGQDDKVETSTIYLDTLPGLEIGMRYHVYASGALEYAGEFLV